MSLSKKIHLQPNEHIVEVAYRYGLTYAWSYLSGFFILGFTAFYLFWLLAHGWWGQLLIAFGVGSGLAIFLRTWLKSRVNFLVITSERVVDVHRPAFFDEIISSLYFENIKDVQIRRHGVGATIFNYGLLRIETKDNTSVLEMSCIHAPERVQSLIFTQKSAAESHKELTNNEKVYQNFLRLIPSLSEAQIYLVEKKIQERIADFQARAGGNKNSML